MWRRTESRPLDLRPLRLPLWDVTSFPSRNAQNVQGVCCFVFPLFLSVEKEMGKNKRQGCAGAPVSWLWSYLRMLSSLRDVLGGPWTVAAMPTRFGLVHEI